MLKFRGRVCNLSPPKPYAFQPALYVLRWSGAYKMARLAVRARAKALVMDMAMDTARGRVRVRVRVEGRVRG